MDGGILNSSPTTTDRRDRPHTADFPERPATHERVVVALSGGPEGEALIRRAARIAERSGQGELLAVHVLSSAVPSPVALRSRRAEVEGLGGSYHQVVGDDVAAALLDFARSADATQLVIGAGRRSRRARSWGGGIGGRVVAGAGEMDVHLVARATPGRGGWRLPPLTGALTARRRWLGLALAVLGVPAATAACLAAGGAASLAVVLLAFLLLVLAVALVGGLWPALLAAVLGGLAENWFFTAPTGGLAVSRVDDVVSLVGGLVVAVTVATVVDRSARRATAAARSRAETAMLASLSRAVLAGDRGLPSLLEQIREAFGLRWVAMVERTADGEDVVGSCGRTDGGTEDAETLPVTGTLALRLAGRSLPAAERRVLLAFAEQAAVALQQGRLAAQAAEADRLAAATSMRTALLAAVSHDLRTPLAGIKAASSALRATDLQLTAADSAELVATIDESADRLTGLVDNLLDMSRVQAGAVNPHLGACDLPAVVHRALTWLDAPSRARLRLHWPADLPLAVADPGLLERVVENLVGNAVRHAPGGPVVLTAGAVGDCVELRVTDHGPGVARGDRDRLFAPFQRLGDSPAGQGVGLGLAVARGLTEAMGGTLTAEDTPGGGLTLTVSLRASGLPAPDRPEPVAVPADVPAP